MSTRFATTQGGAFGRVAAELGLQLDEVGEDVGLAAQLAISGGWIAMVEITVTRTPRR
ncbi:hypothetical protein IVB38_35325 [Bradyrhizobium sp. 38]|nr:hypothetical protein [Bradyrhizobium sp. 38]MCK1777161.1 hypothetical protein [Bradyrhizobium sp. 132]